ncbi:unnamed protein product [Haemonchus placei]|uniref:Uncharacterized protein n=1 Tax=Haemonchus placei TaxID=6290 RepID=A0A0N4W3S5_HAEPC|nr:unnamed protein product [Haemonchus placei]
MRAQLEKGGTDPLLTVQAGLRQLPSMLLVPAWEREELPPIGRALAERMKKNPSHHCCRGLTDLKSEGQKGWELLVLARETALRLRPRPLLGIQRESRLCLDRIPVRKKLMQTHLIGPMLPDLWRTVHGLRERELRVGSSFL